MRHEESIVMEYKANRTLQMYPFMRRFKGPLSAKHPELEDEGHGKSGLSFSSLNPQQFPYKL